MAVRWILSGNKDRPSSRIHGFNVHEALCKKGVASVIDWHPSKYIKDIPFGSIRSKLYVRLIGKNDIVIIQKAKGKRTVNLLKLLKKRGIYTVYVDCDIPVKEKEASHARHIILTSKYLVERYRERFPEKRIDFIDDASELFISPEKKVNANPTKAVWFGFAGTQKWKSYLELKAKVNIWKRDGEISTVLRSVSDSKDADYQWTNDALQLISSFDFATIPLFFDNPMSLGKSSNRVVQAMALGMPVLASPLPSYREVIKDGYNGFLCSTDQDWLSAIKKMEDPKTLKEMSLNAYLFASSHYRIEHIVDEWIEILGICKLQKKEVFRDILIKICLKWI